MVELKFLNNPKGFAFSQAMTQNNVNRKLLHLLFLEYTCPNTSSIAKIVIDTQAFLFAVYWNLRSSGYLFLKHRSLIE